MLADFRLIYRPRLTTVLRVEYCLKLYTFWTLPGQRYIRFLDAMFWMLRLDR
ncbi:hypothetical protein Plhal304r1_c024g0082691 [Plasmopara halstedii]